MAPNLRRYAPIISVALAILVFLLHLFQINQVQTDWITVALLALVAVVPYLSRMTTLSVGQVEMQLQPEINEAQEEVDENIPETTGHSETGRTSEIRNEITQLAAIDPAPALLKLRTEIEQILFRILRSKGIKAKSSPRGLVTILASQGDLPPNVVDSINDVLELCNRAAHGGEINTKEAEEILNLGFRVLEFLYSIYYEDTISPAEEITIDTETVEQYRQGMYRLKTITPYVDEPKQNTRYLTQEALNDFLIGYNEYAEFIISIEKVEEPPFD